MANPNDILKEAMDVIFLETARIELDEAVDYYNYESSGPGERFLGEVIKVLDLIF